MKILLTNDDGYLSKGIKALKKALSKSNDVYMCAPSTEKSGTAHSITILTPIEFDKLSSSEYVLDGLPVDCVVTGLKYFFKDIDFDCIVSGINRGANLGNDIFYSGTFNAAMRAAEEGYTSFAFSVDKRESPYDFERYETYILELINNLMNNNTEIINRAKKYCDDILKLNYGKLSVVYNINFPGNSDIINGYKVADISKRDYKDRIAYITKKGTEYVKIEGDRPIPSNNKNSDSFFTNNGFISITPVFYPENGMPFIYKESIEEIINKL